MKQAILSVTVDEQNTVEVRFQGEAQFHIPMLGSLMIANQYLIDLIKSTQTMTIAGGQTAENSEEKQVSKSEAIGAYLDLRQKIEDRLQSIAKSDEKATFKINETLISNL